MTRKQERARQRRRYQRRVARQAERVAERDRNKRVAVVVVAVLAVVGLLVGVSAAVSSPGGEDGAASSAASSSGDGVTCRDAPPVPGTKAELDLPDASTAKGRTFTAVLTTNCGDITLRLEGTDAPQTVASFVDLARRGYWRDSPCHRLVTSGIHVLQCGDPTGTGQGTPGYSFGIENAPADGDYPRGTVAMARTSDPNSNGGQFFLVTRDSHLPTDGGGYSIFGTVTGGMDVVDHIASAGVAGGGTDGAPAAPMSILRVAATEKKASP